jgi:hypothetical protein
MSALSVDERTERAESEVSVVHFFNKEVIFSLRDVRHKLIYAYLNFYYPVENIKFSILEIKIYFIFLLGYVSGNILFFKFVVEF